MSRGGRCDRASFALSPPPRRYRPSPPGTGRERRSPPPDGNAPHHQPLPLPLCHTRSTIGGQRSTPLPLGEAAWPSGPAAGRGAKKIAGGGEESRHTNRSCPAAASGAPARRSSLEIGRHGDRWPWRAEAIEEARRFKFLPPALYLLLLFIPPPSGIQRQPCRGARMGLQQELTTFAAPATDAASPAEEPPPPEGKGTKEPDLTKSRVVQDMGLPRDSAMKSLAQGGRRSYLSRILMAYSPISTKTSTTLTFPMESS